MTKSQRKNVLPDVRIEPSTYQADAHPMELPRLARNNRVMALDSSQKLLRIKVTPDLHLTYSKNGGNLGLVSKMKNIACISILLTKHVKCTYLYLFKVV